MIIPQYWAEARVQEKNSGRQVTVRRWGWSDSNLEEAQTHAERRAREALARILAGEDLRRREAKEAYGSDEGVPIREEVVSRHPNAVITRNSYGSLCLNTPNVLFADIDTEWGGARRVPPLGGFVLVACGIALGIWQKSFLLGMLVGILPPLLGMLALDRINRRRRPKGEAEAKQRSLERIRAFVSGRPDWNLRVYETPAGFRLLAMHELFDPGGEETKSVLAELNADRRFARLCKLQNCFRARVSPKYWRIGYCPKESLPKSKWPFPEEQLPRRRRWVEGYESLASGFASCRFLETLGRGRTDPEAESVRSLHDSLCRAGSDLPLA